MAQGAVSAMGAGSGEAPVQENLRPLWLSLTLASLLTEALPGAGRRGGVCVCDVVLCYLCLQHTSNNNDLSRLFMQRGPQS